MIAVGVVKHIMRKIQMLMIGVSIVAGIAN